MAAIRHEHLKTAGNLHAAMGIGGFRQPAKSGEKAAQEQRETLYLLDVIRLLVQNGAKVQAACVWSGNWPQLRGPAVEVALHALNPHAFALFENVRFEFAA